MHAGVSSLSRSQRHDWPGIPVVKSLSSGSPTSVCLALVKLHGVQETSHVDSFMDYDVVLPLIWVDRDAIHVQF